MHDWSNAQAYDYTQALSPRGWAWEFLRRNPDFRAEWLQIASSMRVLEGSSTCLSIDAMLSAWGLLFRRPARGGRAACPCVVGPQSVFGRVPGGGRARR
jgi:hypothetical protein